MKLNKREKLLFIFTVVAVFLGVLSQTSFIDFVKSLAISSEELTGEIIKFKNDQEKLIKGEEIKKQYKEIEDQFPQLEKGQKAEHVFSEEINKLCKTLGFQYPTIDPPERTNIEDVEEYQFITLNIRTNGDLASVAKLIKGFSDKKLIIKEINLKSPIDNNNVNVMIKVARIAKAEEDDGKSAKKTKVRR